MRSLENRILTALWSCACFVLCFILLTKKETSSWQNAFKCIVQPVSAISKLQRLKKASSSNFSVSPNGKTAEAQKVPHDYKIEHHISSMEKLFLATYRKEFQRGWCKINKGRMDWENFLAPCIDHTKWDISNAGWRNHALKTSAEHSYTFKWDIRHAGQFSRFFIQTRTSRNLPKKIGGDSWRVLINGVSSISPIVFDHNNGLYEVEFLLMDAGIYDVQIYLDYTLCDGLKDPPIDWYKKGSSQGKNQADGALNGDHPYLMKALENGKPILINVAKPNYSTNVFAAMEKIRNEIYVKNPCNQKCPSLLSSGEGRWNEGAWKPFYNDLSLSQQISPRDAKSILWIYGDSVSKSFAEYLVTGPYQTICTKLFKECKVTYSWVYNIKRGKVEETVDGKDYSHEKVMYEIIKVLDDKRFDERSVLLLNWGIHFAAAVNFTNYRKLIDDFVVTLQAKQRTDLCNNYDERITTNHGQSSTRPTNRNCTY
ncbi:uncharacterized protein LOC124443085 isoform X2 [Xenia sp. Carnegie-2017]|uniref:uncharacterized protein LOC124443085 isoform X2 n=1 Tax=Xenia sp. Carnegie-2017 TaxID=2897299 RepID=UPI001F04F7EF|nr:uncharacterized protein LOC124443085 isoform X2 [Xenia sp. Carnegie-2017]